VLWEQNFRPDAPQPGTAGKSKQ